ncbi:MAG: SMP-30/gluconolactonase/LRE family protein [Alphaproteobacteria bacterium]
MQPPFDPVFDPRQCLLGEGPLWHPERKQLLWFDILAKQLMSRRGNQTLKWQFQDHVSAAARVSKNEILIASEKELLLFNLETNTQTHICPLEADNSTTRSNDGRADPYGGFWIGTMSKTSKPKAGTIYRWYKGKLHTLYQNITTSNSICFSPDQKYACFSDTRERQIMRQKLDSEGWPSGEAKVFIDLNKEKLKPDGAVIDAEGCLWNAQWGAARVARYSPTGNFLMAVNFPATQTSCPAFGGTNLSTLFVTSAADKIKNPSPAQGQTFFKKLSVRGQEEHQVIL